MRVGLLLVTHGNIGRLLIDTAADMIGPLPLQSRALEVRRTQTTDSLLAEGRHMIEQLDDGDGVLILTDAYGSTPSNIAMKLANSPRMKMIAGINLPMLIKIFNYPQCDLPTMAMNALEGGRQGVLMFSRTFKHA